MTVHEESHSHPTHSGCCGCTTGSHVTGVSRRDFLKGGGLALGGLALGGLALGGMALAEPSPATRSAAKKPKAKILQLYSHHGYWSQWSRPDDRPWLKTEAAAFQKHLAALAKQLGDVEFVGPDRPLPPKQALQQAAAKTKEVDAFCLIGCGRGRELAGVFDLGLPTLAFNITCDHFDGHAWDVKRRKCKNQKILILSSRDFSELDRGVRLLRVPGLLKHSRLLTVGNPAGDADTRSFEKVRAALGVQCSAVAAKEIGQACQAVDAKAAEAEAEALWIRPARRVQAKRQDIIAAARLQIALREVMTAQKAQAIAIDCLGTLTKPKMDKEGYPCLGFSVLEDEGWVTSCQGDMDCALTKLIVRHAFGLPSFMGNIYFDTSTGRIVLDHCTAPSKMHGAGGRRLPFDVLTHHTNTGAAPRVEMPVGQPATVVRLVGLKGMLFFDAKITGNPEGTCRTTVEVESPGRRWSFADYHPVGACGGLHQVLCLGARSRDLRDLCTLMGLQHHPNIA